MPHFQQLRPIWMAMCHAHKSIYFHYINIYFMEQILDPASYSIKVSLPLVCRFYSYQAWYTVMGNHWLWITRHVFVKHGCPRRQPSHNIAKISKSYILTLPHPQGHVMSVKCEEPIDELTVQVWFLYHHPNFKYCTLFISGTELRTNRRTDGQTNRRTDGRSDY